MKKPAGRPENLRGVRRALVTGADSAAQPFGDLRRIRLAIEEGLDRGRRGMAAARLANHFTQRPERDALPVGKASAGEHVHLTAETPRKFVDKPCLPKPCLADHRHEHRHPFTSGPSVRGFEPVHLPVPAHQRHIETQRQRTHARLRGSQEESIGTGTVRFDGGRSELLRLPADEDLAGLGGLREPHRLGPSVPREPKRPRPSHQRLARREAEANSQAHTMPAQQNARFGGERASRFQTRPGRPEGIILVHRGDAEDAHQALAGADRQLSPIPLEDRRQARN